MDAQPWERQEGESSKAFAAFCAFRDLGPKRTILAAYVIYSGAQNGGKGSKAPGFIGKWARDNEWHDRVQAFDKHEHDDALALLRHRREEHTIQLWEIMQDVIEMQAARLEGASFDEATRWYNSMRSSIQTFDGGVEGEDKPDAVEAGPTYTDPWLEADKPKKAAS